MTEQLQPFVNPMPDLVVPLDEVAETAPSTQTHSGDAPHPFAQDPRLGRGLNGLSKTHLVPILEELPPTPYFNLLSKEAKEYIPAQGDSTPVPDLGAKDAATPYSSIGEDDDEDGLDASDEGDDDNTPAELTDAENPAKQALKPSNNPYGKRKGMMRGAFLASEAACLASLTKPFDFRPVQKYKALKTMGTRIDFGRFQQIIAARQLNPHGAKAPLRTLEIVIPKPQGFVAKPGDNTATRYDATTQAAAKQSTSPAADTSNTVLNLKGVGLALAETCVDLFALTPDQPRAHAPTGWNFTSGKSTEMKKSDWPAPGF